MKLTGPAWCRSFEKQWAPSEPSLRNARKGKDHSETGALRVAWLFPLCFMYF